MHLSCLANIDEALITSSSRGVVPLIAIDETTIGDGRVGEWARSLQAAYQAYVREKSEKIASSCQCTA